MRAPKVPGSEPLRRGLHCLRCEIDADTTVWEQLDYALAQQQASSLPFDQRERAMQFAVVLPT